MDRDGETDKPRQQSQEHGELDGLILCPSIQDSQHGTRDKLHAIQARNGDMTPTTSDQQLIMMLAVGLGGVLTTQRPLDNRKRAIVDVYRKGEQIGDPRDGSLRSTDDG